MGGLVLVRRTLFSPSSSQTGDSPWIKKFRSFLCGLVAYLEHGERANDHDWGREAQAPRRHLLGDNLVNKWRCARA